MEVYRIYSAIRQGFPLSRMKFFIISVLPFLNYPKDLYVDLSNKMDLEFWDCFGIKKTSVL